MQKELANPSFVRSVGGLDSFVHPESGESFGGEIVLIELHLFFVLQKIFVVHRNERAAEIRRRVGRMLLCSRARFCDVCVCVRGGFAAM